MLFKREIGRKTLDVFVGEFVKEGELAKADDTSITVADVHDGLGAIVADVGVAGECAQRGAVDIDTLLSPLFNIDIVTDFGQVGDVAELTQGDVAA